MQEENQRSRAGLLAVIEDADAELAGLVDEVVGDAGAGEGDDGVRHFGKKRIVALEGSGLAVAIPVGLEDDLRDLAIVGPAGGDAFGATGRAAMQEHHVGMLRERGIENVPDALVIVAGGAAGEGDARAFRDLHFGFGAALGGDESAAVENGGGHVRVVDEVACTGTPCGGGQHFVMFACTVAKVFEDLAALE